MYCNFHPMSLGLEVTEQWRNIESYPISVFEFNEKEPMYQNSPKSQRST